MQSALSAALPGGGSQAIQFALGIVIAHHAVEGMDPGEGGSSLDSIDRSSTRAGVGRTVRDGAPAAVARVAASAWMIRRGGSDAVAEVTPPLTERELKLTAALYASRLRVVDHVRATGRLPEAPNIGGAEIGLRLLAD